MQQHFGKFGERMYALCRGIDNREVSTHSERKSVSVEETYTPDVPDLAACTGHLRPLFESLQARVKRVGAERDIRKLYVKIRFADFRQTTAECLGTTLDQAQFDKLLETGFARGRQPVRLLGVGVRLEEEGDSPQLGLFGSDGEGQDGDGGDDRAD